MAIDMGSGLTFDDLVGLTAQQIYYLHLPNDNLGRAIHKASGLMIEREFEEYSLMELWGDGHTVWQSGENGGIVVVNSSGQFSYSP